MRHTTRTIARTFPPGVKVVDGYPIPAGGSGDGEATGDAPVAETTDPADAGTDGGSATETDDDAGQDDDGGKGSKDAVLADLARERRRRQEIERELKALRRESETEAERREREARESATAPAIRALRSSAVETAAREAGFVYPGDVYALLTSEERDAIEVELDADDAPIIDRDAATKAVKALAKRRPALVKAPDDENTGGKAGAGGADHTAGASRKSSSSDPNANLRDLLNRRLHGTRQ